MPGCLRYRRDIIGEFEVFLIVKKVELLRASIR